MKRVSAVIMIFCLFLIFQRVRGQESSRDTLFLKNYDELNTLFYKWLPKDTLTARAIADVYITKGRVKGDSVRMAKGYYYYAMEFGPEMGLQYADTIIKLTENSKDKFHPTVGYLLKGYWYYYLANYKKSIKYYLVGYRYALKKDNIKHLISIRPAIATLKSKTGDYAGALKIEREHLGALETDSRYKKIYSSDPNHGNQYVQSHLNAMHNLSLSYIDMEKVDSAKIYIRRGIDGSLEHSEIDRYYSFVSAWGKAEYYAGNYQVALDSLKKSVPYLKNKRHVVLGQFYIGKSYEKIGQYRKAFDVFQQVDSMSEKLEYKFPELREVYELLIDYYRQKKEIGSQLVYIDKVLKLDEKLLKERTLDGIISRGYDTPNLLRKKELLIGELEQQHDRNRGYKFLLIATLILFGTGLIYYYTLQRRYRQRYQRLLSNDNRISLSPQAGNDAKSDVGVPEEIFSEIEKRLQKFEKEKRFTDTGVTLYRLAKEFRTNSSYLSRVINTVQGINFSQYLHRLRINDIVDRLKEEEKLRAYSMEALAGEAGYKTVQSFTNAFYKQTGIYPSYFIKMLKKK